MPQAADPSSRTTSSSGKASIAARSRSITDERFERRFSAMGGPGLIRIDHGAGDRQRARAAALEAQNEIERLEHKYSRDRDESLTSLINREAGSGQAVAIDPETVALLRYADTLFQQSDGLFDLSAGVLRRAWDFRSGVLPDGADIAALLPLVGWPQLSWNERAVCLPRRGMEIDFGGCVKEYASDRAAGLLRQQGFEHALVNLAGDISCTGPQGDGRPWQVGISDPRRPSEPIALLAMNGGGLASSGDYERCLVVDGRRYGHLLDPRSGWPVEGLVAVSVLAEQCLVAGSAATIGMLKPEAEALAWLEELGLPWFAVDRALNCHGTLT